MADELVDLWPKDFGPPITDTPFEFLRKQAGLLGSKTSNMVLAEVRTRTDEDDDFRLAFDIVAPALQGYRYTLFELYHKLMFYPLNVIGDSRILEDEEDMKSYVRERLAEDNTSKVINTLIAQSKHGQRPTPRQS